VTFLNDLKKEFTQ
jgi:hypothetical protein